MQRTQLHTHTHTHTHTHLPEANTSIVVLIYCLNHLLQSEVGLWLTQLLHHQLELHEVNEVVPIHIVPERVGGCVCVCVYE